MTDNTINVRLSASAIEVMAWDDPEMRPGTTLEPIGTGRYSCVLTGTRAQLLDLLDQAEHRGAGEGWDQPLSWYRSAQATARKIRAALAQSQGGPR